METENELFHITVNKVDSGVVCLDFRSNPNMGNDAEGATLLGKIGYSSVHFQLSPKDAEKLGALLISQGDQK